MACVPVNGAICPRGTCGSKPDWRERLLLQAPTSLQLGREFAMQITRPSGKLLAL